MKHCHKRKLTLEEAIQALALIDKKKQLNRRQQRRIAKKKGKSKRYFINRKEINYYYCKKCKSFHLTSKRFEFWKTEEAAV